MTRPNLYRGALLGLAAGALGTLAMGQYWTRIAPIIKPKADDTPDQKGPPKPDQNVISPLGQQHEPGESSTAALGRHAYVIVNGHEPGEQTAAALSEAVHWGMGALSGALYGALSARRGAHPLTGALFGTALWLGVDETMMPLLGLQDGPRGSTPAQHADRFGAHLFYGLGLGLSLWALDKIKPD